MRISSKPSGQRGCITIKPGPFESFASNCWKSLMAMYLPPARAYSNCTALAENALISCCNLRTAKMLSLLIPTWRGSASGQGWPRVKPRRKLLKTWNNAAPSWTFAEGHFWLIQFGKAICTSRSPKCPVCPLNDICLYEEKISAAA